MTATRITTVALVAAVAVAASARPALAGDGAKRSEATATALALAPIGAGVAMLALANHSDSGALALGGVAMLTAGPSLGHFYGGAYGRGLLTTGVRSGAVVMAAYGWFLAEDPCFSLDEPCDTGDGDDASGRVLAYAGLGLFAAATVYDVLDAAPAVREHNARISVAPTVIAGAGGPTAGLGLSGSF